MNDKPENEWLSPARRQASRRRQAKSVPDLASLFEQVDQQRTPLAPEPPQPQQPAQPPEPRDRKERLASALSSLGGESEKTEPSPARRVYQDAASKLSLLSEEQKPETRSRLSIPPQLQSYLPSDLWRKINAESPSRGVLLNALERLRSALYQVSIFVPQHVVQEKMRRPVVGLVGGQRLNGTLLFSDVSGFTALSERLVGLGQEGAEILTRHMNVYFTRMLEIIAWSGGVLLKFAGDAMLVYFPELEGGKQARWAARAGLRMLQAMSEFTNIKTPNETVSLKMKIGVATGEFLSASVGSARRMEYAVIGPAVTHTMAAEGAASGAGQLIINQATADLLSPPPRSQSPTGHSEPYPPFIPPFSPDELLMRQGIKLAKMGGQEGGEGSPAPSTGSGQARRAEIPRFARNDMGTEEADTAFLLTPQKPGFYLLQPEDSQSLGKFEITAEKRRARGAMALNASPQAILAQMEVALGQLQAILPYLATELAEQVVAHARERRVRSQYRPTTVLFCNFTGPEALLEAWGAEGVSRLTSLLSAYFEAMHETITRYGGIVTRIDPYSKGTKLLALFGAPVAHEDDPQRAVSAALSMNVELEALNQAWRRKYARHLPANLSGSLFQHRIGVTFGETFAGQVGSPTRREYTVMGDDVNLAARLMGAAEMGQILISQRVYEVVADYFVLTSLPSIRVKGKSKPIPIYQVDGSRNDTLANRVRKRGLLVGREAELSQAEGFLQQALQGKGNILTLHGPAGIGKSHLADTLLNRAQALGAKALFNQCHSYASETPYANWSTFLRDVAGITSTDYEPQAHHDKLHRLLAELSIPETGAPPLATIMGLKRTEARQRHALASGAAAEVGELRSAVMEGHARRRGSSLDFLQQLDEQQTSETGQSWQPVPAQLSPRELDGLRNSLGKLLLRLSEVDPLVIFFEDAHWMDVQSRELLFSLHKQIRKGAVLILLATRDERQAEADEGQALILGPLTAQGTNALVAHLLVTDLSCVIHEQANGNPLFVEEITRWFRRTRNISADELQGVLQASNFLQKLVLSSLETLPEVQREIARVASVVGNEFRTGEVQALSSSPLDASTLSNHLRALTRTQLIVLAEAGADARYAYQQTLVRDILYNSLPHEQRRELHARLAAYLSEPLNRRREVQSRLTALLDSRSVASPAQEAERIAYHYEQAEEWLEAAQSLLRAAEQSRQQKLFPRAAEDYTRGLADLDRLPPEQRQGEVLALRARLQIGQGDMALLGGDYLTALTAYEAARASLGEGAPAEATIDLTCKLALVLPVYKRHEEAETLLRKVIETHALRGHLPAVAIMAWLLWRAGKPEAAEWIERGRALILPEAGRREKELHALLCDFAGEWTAARDSFLELGWRTGAALASIRLGDQYLQQDGPSAALDQFDQAAILWHAVEAKLSGEALALYRKAEVLWQVHKVKAARAALVEAQEKITANAPALQVEGHSAIQRALKLLDSGKGSKWPAWRWQAYDDQFRIAVLAPRE